MCDSTIDTLRISARLFSNSSIIDLKKFLVKQKKQRFYQTSISLPLSLVWVILFAYQISNHIAIQRTNQVDANALVGMNIGTVVGVILAIFVVVALYQKMQRTNDRILSDINQLESED